MPTMSCTCELCTVRHRRNMEQLRVTRRPLVKQHTLPTQIPSHTDRQRSRLPAWTEGLKSRSQSQDCKYDSEESMSSTEELNELTQSSPMNILRRKPSHPKNRLVKRNSLDFEFINGDLEITQGATSASFGDIRIIQSSPTPPQSPTSSVMDLSRNTSVGDISIRSAPTPPHSTLTSAGTTPPSSTESSPDIRRKQWRHKILHLKDDIDKVCSKMKNAKSNLKDSMGSWKTKKPSGRGADGEEDTEDISRKIRVEFIDKQSHRRNRSLDKAYRLFMADREEFDVPDHNISPSLVLTSLENCMFKAQVTMYSLPPGDITLRVSGYRVEIIIHRRKNKNIEDSHRITKPFRYGEIDLPIYVNPNSIKFDYDPEYQLLRLNGMTKGYNAKLISVSNDDLRLLEKQRNKHHGHKHKYKESKLLRDVETIPETPSRAVNRQLLLPKDTSDDESFRTRAYTK